MILKFNKNIYDYEPTGCEVGRPVGFEVTPSIDENGVAFLESEEYDLQAVIDSFAEACSIERILIAHGLGDETALNKKPGVYLDEDQVNIVKNAQSNTLELNAQLLSLYQGYKDVMSFDQFSNFVAHGDFTALDEAKKSKEEVTQ